MKDVRLLLRHRGVNLEDPELQMVERFCEESLAVLSLQPRRTALERPRGRLAVSQIRSPPRNCDWSPSEPLLLDGGRSDPLASLVWCINRSGNGCCWQTIPS
jgi:hypothetical protein